MVNLCVVLQYYHVKALVSASEVVNRGTAMLSIIIKQLLIFRSIVMQYNLCQYINFVMCYRTSKYR